MRPVSNGTEHVLCCSFMSDIDSWMELCDLYLTEQDYGKAAFCIEELILSNPRNHLFHQKYAEVSCVLFSVVLM